MQELTEEVSAEGTNANQKFHRVRLTTIFASIFTISATIFLVLKFLETPNADKNKAVTGINKLGFVKNRSDIGGNRIKIPTHPLERRQFEALVLENGIEVLLISNPLALESGAAISVSSGSLSETDIPGLAHFLEHMLFLGSEKYPAEGEFQKKIAVFGGKTNAYVSSVESVYAFTIEASKFGEAIDMFAQFFESPLLLDSSLKREALAVDNEFVLSKGYEMQRLLRILNILMHPKSLPARFTIGTYMDLIEIPISQGKIIRNVVRDFLLENYSAKNMKLAMMGRESLDELEMLARGAFSGIADRDLKQKNWSEFPRINSDYYMQGKIVKYKSFSLRLINIGFVLDNEYIRNNYKDRPLTYLSRLIEAEHEEGLLYLLKVKKNFASKIKTNVLGSSVELNYTIFSIDIELNKNGYSHLFEIVEIVFSYLKLIKQEGIKRHIFDQFRRNNGYSFNWTHENNDVYDEIQNLCIAMQFTPLKEVITHNIIDKWDEPLLNHIANQLTPSKTFIIIGSPDYEFEPLADEIHVDINDKKSFESFYKNQSLVNKDELYELPYSMRNLTGEMIISLETLKIPSYLRLPLENRYIPDELKIEGINCDVLEPVCRKNHSEKIKKEDSNKVPKVLINETGNLIYYLKDRTFFVPRYKGEFYFGSNYQIKSAEDKLIHILFFKYYKQKDFPRAYYPSLGGYHASIETDKIHFSGFSDKLHIAVEDLIKRFNELIFDYSNFEDLYSATLDEIKSSDFDLAYMQAYNELRLILKNIPYNSSDLLDVGSNLTAREAFLKIIKFKKEFFSQLNFKGLLLGNLDKRLANSIWSCVKKMGFLSFSHNETLSLRSGITNLNGSFYSLRLYNKNAFDDNSAVVNYYQVGLSTTSSNAKLDLLISILSSEAFNYLRTKLQLGYIAGCISFALENVNGFVIVVQGDRFSPSANDKRIEEFLLIFENKLKNLTSLEFNTIIESSINTLSSKQIHFDKKFEYFSSIIRQHSNNFSLNEEKIQILRNLTRTDLYHFYKKILKNSPKGKISVQIYSTKFKAAMVIENRHPGTSYSGIETRVVFAPSEIDRVNTYINETKNILDTN